MVYRKNTPKDYYAILNVAPDAPAAAIKESYRLLAQKYHPDRVQSTEEAEAATERMVEINEAFAVLSSKQKRTAYDRAVAVANAPPAPPPEPSIDYDSLIKTPATPATKHAVNQNPVLNQAVTAQFLTSLKNSVVQRGADLKLKEETEKYWTWSFSGGNWKKSYWISLRQLNLLNLNVAREMISQIKGIIGRRNSLWKDCSFIFVLGFASMEETANVMKAFRLFCMENRRVSIVMLDLIHRRSVLSRRRPDDPNMQLLLRAVGVETS